MKTKVLGAFPAMGRHLPMLFLTLLLRPIPGEAQKVTLKRHHMAIVDAFSEIEVQTGCLILYSPAIFNDAPLIDPDIENATARRALSDCLAGLRFRVDANDEKSFTIFREPDTGPYAEMRGVVIDAAKEPLAGATVSIKGSNVAVQTNAEGQFRLPVNSFLTVVTVSHTGHATQAALRSNKSPQYIQLPSASVGLDAVMIMAYGKTTPRLTTNIEAKVKAGDIADAPVSNLLAALEGRVSRLAIRQYNGVPGSAYETILGGRHSIQQGNEPLYVLDGVPLPGSGFLPPIGSGSAQGAAGASSLNVIPVGDIGSIEILKDASATAIYGSRASNGVILITTKEGGSAQPRWTAEFSQGATRTVRTSPLLNTAQFLSLRREAIRNDGDSVNPVTLPEAFSWDGNRNMDYQKFVSGGTGSYRDIRLGFNGGDSLTRILLSGSAHNESGVFPGTTNDQRLSLYTNVRSQTLSRRLKIGFNGLYTREDTHLPWEDYSPYTYLAPNAPAFTDAAGQLQWGPPAMFYENIMALRHNSYVGSVDNLFGQVQLSSSLNRNISFESNIGGNSINTHQQSWLTIAGQFPHKIPSAAGRVFSASNNFKSAIVELWGRYAGQLGPGRLEVLTGVSYQGQGSDYSSLLLDGLSNDLLLPGGNGATTITPASNKVYYRYDALFGRASYNIRNKYLLSVSGRRDGSSRFGPGDQFGTFLGGGAAWIFSEEPFAAHWKGFSFGKLKVSYGTTGNDQIGDNQYAELYAASSSARGYQGQQGVVPVSLANDQLRWELNYRAEAALELGFLADRVHLSAGAYRGHTANQLVYTRLPPQAGFPGVLSNESANVVNEGLEFLLETNLPLGPSWHWSSSLVLTFPRNYLKSWSQLARSSLSATLVEGKSLSVTKGLHLMGVDPNTGLYTFLDVNHDGHIDLGDYVPSPSLDPKWYGGWKTDLQYKGWGLDIFFQYRGGNGVNPLTVLDNRNPAGMKASYQLSNGPVEWLSHWRQQGDVNNRQRLTQSENSPASATLKEYLQSDAAVIDASFLRLKTIALYYKFLPDWQKRHHLRELKLYLQGQNLWTRTHYPVTDPETQDPFALPPMRTLVAGFQISF